jgi:hypothetical protein
MEVNRPTLYNSSAVRRVAIKGRFKPDRTSRDRLIVSGYDSKEITVYLHDVDIARSTESSRVLYNYVQDRLHIGGRACNDT